MTKRVAGKVAMVTESAAFKMNQTGFEVVDL
jgi:hypothetical protein